MVGEKKKNNGNHFNLSTSSRPVTPEPHKRFVVRVGGLDHRSSDKSEKQPSAGRSLFNTRVGIQFSGLVNDYYQVEYQSIFYFLWYLVLEYTNNYL